MNNGILPPEMYKESLGYLSLGDLKCTSLTSRAFRRIAQPLLFSELWVNLWPAGRPINRNSRNKMLACLRFYSSQRIAPSFRACHITTHIEDEDSRDPEITALSQEIITAAFNASRHFPNLRSVCIWCSDGRGVQIDSKTPLDSATGIDTILAGLSLSPYIESAKPYDTQAVEHLPFLCRDATTLLINWDEETDSTFIVTLAVTGSVLPHLSKLTIKPHSDAQAALFTDLLCLCPALEQLTVLWDYDWLETRAEQVAIVPVPGAVPRLVLYEGPSDGVNVFMVDGLCAILLSPGPRRKCGETTSWRPSAASRGGSASCHWICACIILMRISWRMSTRLSRTSRLWPSGRRNTGDIIVYSALREPGEHLQTLQFLTICLNEYEILEEEEMDDSDGANANENLV
ncbi:hypothetical protein DFH07DRAFT_379503 [Mycena maculata]|uniref:F-box domain-containing protein n=1 Tax=Mycena maculata TaxID=230809 RepID=A0AAD7JKB6_9AGAR|nr:hypothetical protein DFH07DRAFT_379503 [Mycena maculata]